MSDSEPKEPDPMEQSSLRRSEHVSPNLYLPIKDDENDRESPAPSSKSKETSRPNNSPTNRSPILSKRPDHESQNHEQEEQEILAPLRRSDEDTKILDPSRRDEGLDAKDPEHLRDADDYAPMSPDPTFLNEAYEPPKMIKATVMKEKDLIAGKAINRQRADSSTNSELSTRPIVKERSPFENKPIPTLASRHYNHGHDFFRRNDSSSDRQQHSRLPTSQGSRSPSSDNRIPTRVTRDYSLRDDRNNRGSRSPSSSWRPKSPRRSYNHRDSFRRDFRERTPPDLPTTYKAKVVKESRDILPRRQISTYNTPRRNDSSRASSWRSDHSATNESPRINPWLTDTPASPPQEGQSSMSPFQTRFTPTYRDFPKEIPAPPPKRPRKLRYHLIALDEEPFDYPLDVIAKRKERQELIEQHRLGLTPAQKAEKTTQQVPTPFGVYPVSDPPAYETFILEPSSGYYYDENTGYYHDKNSGYFFDRGKAEWLFYSTTYKAYIPCEGGDVEAKKELQRKESGVEAKESPKKNLALESVLKTLVSSMGQNKNLNQDVLVKEIISVIATRSDETEHHGFSSSRRNASFDNLHSEPEYNSPSGSRSYSNSPKILVEKAPIKGFRGSGNPVLKEDETEYKKVPKIGKFKVYPAPVHENFKYQDDIGLYLDETTGFFYCSHQKRFFDPKTNEWLFYSSMYGVYIPVGGDNEDEKSKLEKSEKMYQDVNKLIEEKRKNRESGLEPALTPAVAAGSAFPTSLMDPSARLFDDNGFLIPTFQQPRFPGPPRFYGAPTQRMDYPPNMPPLPLMGGTRRPPMNYRLSAPYGRGHFPGAEKHYRPG